MTPDFSAAERTALYRAIALRRDVRAEFSGDPVPDEVLERVLDAAHHAPSVGLSQPWRFIVVRSLETRRSVHDAFRRANAEAATDYDAQTASQYEALRLQGILDAPVGICVTCDDDPQRGNGLGRRTMPETARYSTVCAIQNLWLAARVEGLGVGWVSIVEPDELRTLLEIPKDVAVVAYLCVGYVTHFAPVADLERDRWETRAPLTDVVDYERYGGRAVTVSSAINEKA
ncbi:MAG: 5,6-dimethylbenzimidazole synthase [Candidatus Eremiobacteraeota bacterium]|nr:5,6-dimethylbenzimidazole synthase [Candidatus Eremiobacteraeota bacterium]